MSTLPVKCIVPGCSKIAHNRIGVRCRVMNGGKLKGKTAALWAPETNAWLCDQHALSGAHVTLIYEPTDTREVSTSVISRAQERRASSRRVKIK